MICPGEILICDFALLLCVGGILICPEEISITVFAILICVLAFHYVLEA